MDAQRILAGLGERGRVPVEAIAAARAERAAMIPVFLQAIDAVAAGTAPPAVADGVFLAFHLLGEWRERSAYRPLAKLLRLPTEAAEEILGDAPTVTAARVMAAVFDGDPAPLYEVIGDPEADEYARAAMCQTLAILTWRGALAREDTAAFLRAAFDTLEPRHDCHVWHGWMMAVASLGLAELAPLVRQAYARGSIDKSFMSLADFEDDLRHALAHPDAPLHADGALTPFGDTVEELADWACFRPPEPAAEEDPEAPWSERFAFMPARNPFRGVGRNDPCPCGSGKKFKRCCLDAADLPPTDGL